MPELKNPRHERYAQALATGMPQCEAYIEAGYTDQPARASNLASKSNIRARVAELQNEAADGAVLTIQGLILKALALREDAHDAKDWGSALRANEQVAKLAGLWTDKSEHEHRGAVAPVTVEIVQFAQNPTDGDGEACSSDSGSAVSVVGMPHMRKSQAANDAEGARR